MGIAADAAEEYTLAINNGRVIDPESGLDAVRHLGIQHGRIVLLAEQPLQAPVTIDAAGLVVAPGFIDLHTHSPTPLGQYFQAFDGVTTALELEAGFHPVLDYAGEIDQAPLINYGASAGHVMARILEKNGLRMSGGQAAPQPVGFKGWLTALKFLFSGADGALSASLREPADAEELQRLRRMLEADLDAGALGIGLPLDYFSAAIQEAEMRMLFEVAADYSAPLFIHIRRGIDGDPAGLLEVLDYAREYGTAIHVCHITHSAMSELDQFLAAISQAREEGVDVSTEVLPYNAGSAAIGSAVFGRDWLTIFNITYEDVQWAETGARFNREMWETYREKYPQGVVIHHYLKEEWTRRAVAEPGVMIVSDLVAMHTREKKVAPHNGAFSKVLGRYVREAGLLDLSTAIGKMTWLPARRLETFAPAFRSKGRLQPGMDADITIFNPRTIIDNATYMNPYQEASGIAHVIVGGVPVIREGELVPGQYPGRRLLSGAE
ncbi:MAG: amidohydrolase family protein [Halioglobus sp.]